MAKMLFTAIVADMRGKLNGSVMSKNRYGAYMRTKVTPVNPQTVAQQVIRQTLGSLSTQWRALTEDQRKAWNSAAPSFTFTDIFGNQKILSGQTLFVSLNMNLVNAGQTQLTDPPSPGAVVALFVTNLAADQGTGDITFDIDPVAVPAGYTLVVYATGMVTPGKSFVKNLFRYVGYDTNTAGTINIKNAWAAKFGALTLDQKIFVRCALLNNDTGELGVPVQVQGFVS